MSNCYIISVNNRLRCEPKYTGSFTVKLASAELLSNTSGKFCQRKRKVIEETKYKAQLTPAIFPLPKKMRGESP